MELEDAYQAMLRQRAADDAAMFGQASSASSLGFGPVGAELAGGGPATMGPGEQQRFEAMAQMNGAAPGAGPPPPLDTRSAPGDVVAMMGGSRAAPSQQQQGLGVKRGDFVLDFD